MKGNGAQAPMKFSKGLRNLTACLALKLMLKDATALPREGVGLNPEFFPVPLKPSRPEAQALQNIVLQTHSRFGGRCSLEPGFYNVPGPAGLGLGAQPLSSDL